MPYVVKGMDSRFRDRYRGTEALKSTSLEEICYSFQETAFSMLVEVSERALHNGQIRVALAGGVGANKRLREMLSIMCAQRGARFCAPKSEYCETTAP